MLRTSYVTQDVPSAGLSPDFVGLLPGGCALIVATVGPDGAPLATRGWGLLVLSPTDGGALRIRLVVDADDAPALDQLAPARRVAVTGADVRTLRSAQVKGRIVEAEPATADDEQLAATYCDDFFDAVVQTDGADRRLLERLVPSRYGAWVVVVDEVFDQTPGPEAGARVREAAG
jgi:hypothetical protein